MKKRLRAGVAALIIASMGPVNPGALVYSAPRIQPVPYELSERGYYDEPADKWWDNAGGNDYRESRREPETAQRPRAVPPASTRRETDNEAIRARREAERARLEEERAEIERERAQLKREREQFEKERENQERIRQERERPEEPAPVNYSDGEESGLHNPVNAPAPPAPVRKPETPKSKLITEPTESANVISSVSLDNQQQSSLNDGEIKLPNDRKVDVDLNMATIVGVKSSDVGDMITRYITIKFPNYSLKSATPHSSTFSAFVKHVLAGYATLDITFTYAEQNDLVVLRGNGVMHVDPSDIVRHAVGLRPYKDKVNQKDINYNVRTIKWLLNGRYTYGFTLDGKKIKQVVPGGCFDLAGVRVGDKILKVDGKNPKSEKDITMQIGEQGVTSFRFKRDEAEFVLVIPGQFQTPEEFQQSMGV